MGPFLAGQVMRPRPVFVSRLRCDCSRNVIAEIACISQGLCVAETHGVSCLLRGQRLGEGPLASDWVVVSGAVPPDL